MKRLLCAAALLGMAASLASAADSAVGRYAKHLQISRDFTIRVAEQMPDADYSFKLTPPQMSFAQQLVHIGESNLYFYSTLAGEKQPFAKPADATKAAVIEYLTKSFNYSLGVLQKLSPAQLDKSFAAEGGQMVGWELVMLSLDHTTHHRAQCEMYLRVKGITPTDYTF